MASTSRPDASVPDAAALRAWFDTLEVPTALCTHDGLLRAWTPSFQALCGGRVEQGRSLCELLSLPGLPEDADVAPREVEATLGEVSLRLRFTRRGEHLTVAASLLTRPHREEVAEALLELSRRMVGVTSEEMLVAAVSRGLKRLFPGALYCIRLTNPQTLALSSVYSEGKLREGVRGPLVLKRTSLEKSGLPAGLDPQRISVVSEGVPPLFLRTHAQLSAPLVANGQLFGVLTVEYPEGQAADVDQDHRLLLQLANQVSVAVRNVKLIEELTLTRSYLTELLEGASALIVVTDRDLKVVMFNRALREMSGQPRERVLGLPVEKLLPRDQRENLRELLHMVLEGGRTGSFELEIPNANGQPVRVSMALSPVRNAQGEVDGVVAVGQDLTHLRQLEQRIVQSEKLAGLGQLAASVAHEINNPMTAVAAYASALYDRIRGVGAAADAEKLKRILEASERILNFTRDLTNYARPGQSREAPEPLDLREVMQTSVGFCEHVATSSGVTLALESGEALPVRAIRGRLMQVFVNLITNACHATPAGGRIVLRGRVESGEAVVEVEDNGAGIPVEVRERIFDPFFTTKPQGKGTGLGLSIVRDIVEEHRGTISLRTTPGQGTVFIVRLPLRRA